MWGEGVEQIKSHEGSNIWLQQKDFGTFHIFRTIIVINVQKVY